MECCISPRVMNLFQRSRRKGKMLMDLIRNKPNGKYILTVRPDFVDIAFADQSIEKQFTDIENK